LKKFFLLCLIGFAIVSAKSQNSERPWLIGISSNYADFDAVEMKFPDQIFDANWMGKTLPSKIKLSRLLNRSFTFGAEFSTITLEPDKMNLIPTLNPVTTDKFWRIGGHLEYKFTNGYLLKVDNWFDPYVFLGLNGSTINEKTYLTQSTGLGINVWLKDWFGINGQVSYDYLFDWNDYFHYSFGVVFRFGKKEETPVKPPKVVEEVVVPIIEVIEDPEPVIEEPVVEEPVIEEPVVIEPKPIEEVIKEIVESISFRAQRILFEVSSATILPASFEELDGIVEIMKRFPDSRFTIFGYTDNTGSAAFNLQLSKDRANAVASYLIEKGVTRNRLVVDGFGIQNPIATNDTPEGRTRNRRVEIKLID
jgi:outer membrane protein OmpA-like peptidoglycan-associated protein